MVNAGNGAATRISGGMIDQSGYFRWMVVARLVRGLRSAPTGTSAGWPASRIVGKAETFGRNAQHARAVDCARIVLIVIDGDGKDASLGTNTQNFVAPATVGVRTT